MPVPSGRLRGGRVPVLATASRWRTWWMPCTRRCSSARQPKAAHSPRRSSGRWPRMLTYQIAQANNALVFPGLGLGVIVARARRISDRMLAAAADAVAGLSEASEPGAPLLPPVDNLRMVSASVAVAVAKAAVAEELAQVELHDPIQQVHEAMWQPHYPRVEPV